MKTIQEKTVPMLETFRKLLTGLSEYYHEDGAGEEKPPIDNAILKDQLALLREACEDLIDKIR